MKNLVFVSFLSVVLPISLYAQHRAVASPANDYAIAVAWQQHSGEYRALSFQAYNFARLSLEQKLQQNGTTKKSCVVVDIDETVLDNSPYQGSELKKGLSFDANDWSAWTAKGQADTVPGAHSFLKYAESKGVETFYVSNRDGSDFDGTLANLQRFGFPFADKAHLMLKTETSDKEARRQEILKQYQILLLCGDNLSDFSNVFYREGKDVIAEVNQLQKEFGSRFIVLPNPMYGDWEKLLYKGDHLEEAEKSMQRINGLKGF